MEKLAGKININRLFLSSKPALERMKDALYELAVEISDHDGDIWASPDICNIMIIAANLHYDTATVIKEKPEFCGQWMGRKVFVDKKLHDEWELR